ncbi:hypothetical protein [Rhodoflexus sp.]
MKKTKEKEGISDFLSVDEHGNLIGADQILKSASPKQKPFTGKWLVCSFFLLITKSVIGISLLVNFYETTQLPPHWVSFGLVCLTLILPLSFFFAVLRLLLR